jgi:hypothetical protein
MTTYSCVEVRSMSVNYLATTSYLQQYFMNYYILIADCVKLYFSAIPQETDVC